MNNRFMFILLVLIPYGCKMKKEKSEVLRADRQMQSSLSMNISWSELRHSDSSYRIWRFVSDSSFYFHPDEGLWGRSGKIAYSERKGSEKRINGLHLDYDSVGIANAKVQLDTHSNWSRSVWSPWLGLLLVPVLAALYWFWRK